MPKEKRAHSSVGPIWQEIYERGSALNRYPFDQVVSFIYRNYPRNKPKECTKILEIGCGAGNNLWFAAREGFSVTGVDGSPSAIDYARQRFKDENLTADLRVLDFSTLPFDDSSFDFVIDRAALTCSSTEEASKTISEIHRVLVPRGLFFFNPYSDHHSSFTSGTPGPGDITTNITGGTLTGIGPIRFYGKRDILNFFRSGWVVRSLRHVIFMEELSPAYSCHAEWILIAEKNDDENRH